jgi:hypothetical protein
MSQGCPVAAFPVTGPIDIIENHVTGALALNLEDSINECFRLDRDYIRFRSKQWTWNKCWQQFKENLVTKIQ